MEAGWAMPLNGTLVVGQEQDLLGGGFDLTQILMGDMTQLSVWDRALTAAEVGRIAACQEVGRGNVLSSDVTELEVVGPVKQQWEKIGTFCRSSSHYFLMLPEMRSITASVSLCNIFNATVATPSSDSDNQNLLEEMLPFSDVCFPSSTWKTWIGISDELEEDVWRDFSTQEPVEFLRFGALFPHGGRIYNCACLMVDGFWIDTDCTNTNRRCTACQVQYSDFLRLRGLCFDSEHQTRFRSDGYMGGRPFFRGFYDMLVTWNAQQKEWKLHSVAENRTLASLSTVPLKSYPLGRHTWVTHEELCGRPPGSGIVLSLSPCNSQYHFMCRSGNCIAHNKRCNLRYDCLDGSDEANCDMILVGKEYQRQIPPAGPSNSALYLVPSLTLTRIASVDDINMAITLEFDVVLTWTDNRVTLKHLSESGGILTSAGAAKMWTPRYQFTNLEGGQVKLLEESVVATTANNATFPDYNSEDMDITYPGSENKLSIIQHYTAKITCDLRFLAYPFDIQVCGIDIHLPSTYGAYVSFSTAEGKMSYTGQEDLALYTVKSARIGKHSTRTAISFEFALHRRPGVAILSTFLPSILLLLVSWATLFVRFSDLNVRAIMSLTTLLVLYTLFANQTNALPKTSEVKLIDIWFFYIIFLLFINIIFHIFVAEEDALTGTAPKNLIRIAPVESKNPGPPLLRRRIPYRFLRRYRDAILPIAVVIFNIMFWVAVFLLKD
ncbi:gamma-aminobutyric acid receptor subunit delta-like isoform X2 [Penaeus vannamei]